MNVFFRHFTICGRNEDPTALNDINDTALELEQPARVSAYDRQAGEERSDSFGPALSGTRSFR